MAVRLLDPDKQIFDEASKEFVSQKHVQIAEIINDFDSSLQLMFLPRQAQNAFQKPYALGQIHPGTHEPQIIMYLGEEDLNQSLIARLFRMRQMAEGRPGSLADALDDADRLVEMRAELERRDEMAEAHDKARFMIKSPLHTINMDGRRFHV